MQNCSISINIKQSCFKTLIYDVSLKYSLEHTQMTKSMYYWHVWRHPPLSDFSLRLTFGLKSKATLRPGAQSYKSTGDSGPYPQQANDS